MADPMAARLRALEEMTTAQLREEWRRLLKEEPRSFNRRWLVKRLCWTVQALEYGGLSARAKARLEALMPLAEMWMPLGRKAFQDPRDASGAAGNGSGALRPGTTLTRPYKGRTVAVTVLQDGFEYEGRRYGSLTAVAKAVTGAHWNGRHFFGLARSKKAR